MKLSLPFRSLMIGVAVVAVACGGSDDATTGADDSGVARTVQVTMADNRFEPATLDVQAGEKVTFVLRNDGTVVHDAFVGDSAAQAEHETEMRGAGNGHDGHGMGDDDAVTVEPGQTGTLTHTFDKAGAIEIGCHEPGHFAGGMKIAVTVS